MDSKALIGVALTITRALQRDYAEYLQACELDYRNGHRAHYCEHGADRWTDYDNICQGCEDGVTMGDGLQLRSRALQLAHEWADAVRALLDAQSVCRGAVWSLGLSSHTTAALLPEDAWRTAYDALNRRYRVA